MNDVQIEMTRDLEKAREAHCRGDVEASITAHKMKSSSSQSTVNTRGWRPHNSAIEQHSYVGQYIKSIVFGGVDGVVTTFAVVAGSSGAKLSPGIIILLGITNLLADGLSMGIGDYLSSKAELEFALKERNREVWETENFIDGEKQEMVEIYQKKGMTEEDAVAVIEIISKYKDFFVDAMLVDELGIQPPDLSTHPWKNGMVTFASFLVFGFIPLISYILNYAYQNQNLKFDPTFLIACLLTGITLFVLGVIKSRITKQHWLKSGGLVLLTGGLAAAVAFLVGYILEPLAK